MKALPTTPQWMLDLKEGDIFEMPGLMLGLDPKENLVFKVLEVAEIISGAPKVWRLTVHAYYHDVFIASGWVNIGVGVYPNWSFT